MPLFFADFDLYFQPILCYTDYVIGEHIFFTEVLIMKKTSKNTNMGMVLGMCLGLSMGTAFGSLFHNMAMGSCLGLSLGMLLGLILGSQKDKAVNEQIEKDGYAVKHIQKDEEAYKITIVNKSEEEQIVTVSKGEQNEENFQIGDLVFRNEDGSIEQAYDADDE